MKLHEFFTYSALFVVSAVTFAACSDNEPGNDESRSEIVLEPAEENVNIAINSFSLDVVHSVIENSNGENVMVSPLSLNMALGLLANGLGGDSYNELFSAIGINDVSALNSLNNKILTALPTADKNCEVVLANSVWSVNPIKSEYTSLVENIYSANTFSVDKLSKPQIDKWGAEKTGGKITDVAGSDIEDNNFALFNLFYFKGNWTDPFNPKNTTKSEFTTIDNEKVQVDMREGKFKGFDALSNDVMRMVCIRFGRMNHFTMCAIIPDDGVSVADAVKSLDDWWNASLVRVTSEIKIALPKFKLDLNADLVPTLKSLGLTEIFNDCDFGPMLGRKGKVNKIEQKINFAVDETGAEAKVVTKVNGITADFGPGVTDFIFDRPFAFLIIENDTKAILLGGVINRL